MPHWPGSSAKRSDRLRMSAARAWKPSLLAAVGESAPTAFSWTSTAAQTVP